MKSNYFKKNFKYFKKYLFINFMKLISKFKIYFNNFIKFNLKKIFKFKEIKNRFIYKLRIIYIIIN